MQLQSSSHSAETSHDRSAGNITLGKTPGQEDPGSFLRQVAACVGPASTST
jgi:hypothetical protein